MKLVNLTQHTINVFAEDKTTQLFAVEPNGIVPRVGTVQEVVGDVNGVEIRKTSYTDVIDMPQPRTCVVYIVSQMVLARLVEMGRTDAVSPDTGAGCVRNDKGQIIGTTGFVTL